MIWAVISLALAAGPTAGASVEGQVVYKGSVRPKPPTHVFQDAEACGKEQPDPSLVLGPQGELANVVVYVKTPPPTLAAAKPTEIALDQRGCRYEPHVVAARVGDTLVTTNSDSVLHNVHAAQAKAAGFNFAMPFKGAQRKVPLTKAGLLKTSCDAGHTWMSGFVHVFDHPFFAVTDQKGRFSLQGLPPGTWTLTAWHERFGEKTVTVTVPPAGSAQTSVQFE